jgi:CO/xanthine dehydrogenase Mo-binding subunit
MLSQCDNARLDDTVARLALYPPIGMHTPHTAWGVYTLECATDELAYTLGMDPLDLRLKHDAEKDRSEDKPCLSKAGRACDRRRGDIRVGATPAQPAVHAHGGRHMRARESRVDGGWQHSRSEEGHT